ncbi:hypothetical protein BDU57DRAFT_564281 [Ampelomyces quisqualis]|uniref:FAD-binding domain-containing protein n=1 Tax=Ampelomyces quisqualis TaxID=50730 RepID=A0A6A5R4Q1_AMPQU|nr:hypothetical protein BDU57DRAFT_564281 [Ampelomyces quisqualis]
MATTKSLANNTTTNGATTTPNPLPILIAGGGCVGLFLSLLLTTSPLSHPIILLEPSSPDPSSTRAMAHQPPTYPILSRIPGLLAELIATGSLSSGLCFRTSVGHGSRVIAEKKFDNRGEGKGQLLLAQGRFQEVLMRRVGERGGGDVRIGWRVVGVEKRAGGGGVRVRAVHDADGREEVIDARFLVGADGGRSLVRKELGASFDGETLDAQLVALDLHFDFQRYNFHDANFIIDPSHYGLIGRITSSTPALWRVSYGVPLGLSEADIEAGVHDKLAHMLPNAGLDENGKRAYEVVRIAPYKAQQRLASTLYESGVCLIGDAAHLTNPYAGLGLASGIADASSLADVLLRVLSNQATDGEKLLRAWSEARRAKFMEVVDKPSRLAYARVRSDVSSEEKVQELLQKDKMVGALKQGMPVAPKSLETKGEELEGW